MKKLTKIALLFVVALVCLATATTVNAATNEDLVKYLGGKFLHAPVTAEIEEYLLENPVTPEVADKIIANVEKITKIVGNETDLSKISKDVLPEVEDLAREAVELAGGKLRIVTRDGKTEVAITDVDGNLLATPVTAEDFRRMEVNEKQEVPAPADKKDPVGEDKGEEQEPPVEGDKTEDPTEVKEDKGEAETTGVVYTNIIIALVVVGLAGLGIAYFVKKD